MCEEEFTKAAKYISSLDKASGVKPTDEQKLEFYKFYKQVKDGDCTGDRPGVLSPEARKKWDAWESVKGVDKKEAMKKYVAALDAIAPEWKKSA